MYIFIPLQSIVNVKPESHEETEEEKEQKHKTFVEKYEKQIKHFGKFFFFFPHLPLLNHWVLFHHSDILASLHEN